MMKTIHSTDESVQPRKKKYVCPDGENMDMMICTEGGTAGKNDGGGYS